MKRLERYDVFSLPVSEVYYDAAFNCRGQFTLQSVEELAQSIDELGLQIPVVVQPAEEIEDFEHADYRWRLISGHRRLRAVTTFLKWTDIPATIRAGLTDRQARMFDFTENLEREDLNVLEEARVLSSCWFSLKEVDSSAAPYRPVGHISDRQVAQLELLEVTLQMIRQQVRVFNYKLLRHCQQLGDERSSSNARSGT